MFQFNRYHSLSQLIIILAVLFGANNLLNAQHAAPTVVPPTPNVASLGKFIEAPVGTYTGTASVSVPIWTIEEGNIKVPVSLSYHAGGIKVAEIASLVGLGWALQSGGMITRTVLGLPDESQLGYLNSSVATEPDNIRKYQYTLGAIDGQPDIFYCNINGRSFRFVFDENGNRITIPQLNVIIDEPVVSMVDFESGAQQRISSWKVTDEGGMVYEFNAYEKSRTSSVVFGSSSADFNNAVNSWYLTKISAPTGESLTFEYSDESYNYDLQTSSTAYFLLPGGGQYCEGDGPESGTSALRQYNNAKRLASITFSNGIVRFIPYERSRADLICSKALQKIVIEDLSGAVRKQFQLSHGYLIGNAIIPDSDVQPSTGENNYYQGSFYTDYPTSFKRRLMLTGVIEKDGAGVAFNEGYKFDYFHEVGLPNRGYPVMDHWGYANSAEVFNGQPEYIYNNGHFEWLNKSPDHEFAKQGTLSKVTYPTGGHTRYEYQPHVVTGSPAITPPVWKFKYGPGLNMSHANYNLLERDYPYENILTNGDLLRHYYTEFTVNSQSQPVDTDITLTNAPYFSTGVLKYYLVNLNNPGIVVWSGYVNGTFSISLTNGTYRLYHQPSKELLNSPNHPNYATLYNATIGGWYEQLPATEGPNQYKVGGLKVSRITQYPSDSDSPIIKNYDYKTSDGSSGFMISFPKYLHDYEESKTLPSAEVVLVTCKYKVLSSESHAPLSTTQGSYVGYSFVTEQQVDKNSNALGKTEYSYTSDPDVFVEGNANEMLNTFPFRPADNRDWLRGQLRKMSIYAYTNNTYKLLKEATHSFNQKSIVPVSRGRKYGFTNKVLHSPVQSDFAGGLYNIYSGYIFNNHTTAMQNDVTTVTEYTYSIESLLPVHTVTYSSDDTREHQYVTYPLEYPAGTDFIDQLVTSNIVNDEIERITVKEDVLNNFLVTSGTLKKYDLDGKGNVIELRNLETSMVIPKNQFKFSPRPLGVLPPDGIMSQFVPDDRYKTKITFNRYDKSKLVEYTEDGNNSTSIIWGYKKQFPVAKIQNAIYAMVESVLGSNLDLGSNGLSAVQNNMLRSSIVFKNSFITTYSYDPLIGMTAMTDANNITTYYEYDTLGRLWIIKDNDGNIVKRYTYQYATEN